MMKKILFMLLSLTAVIGLTAPTFATDITRPRDEAITLATLEAVECTAEIGFPSYENIILTVGEKETTTALRENGRDTIIIEIVTGKVTSSNGDGRLFDYLGYENYDYISYASVEDRTNQHLEERYATALIHQNRSGEDYIIERFDVPYVK